MNIAMAKKVMLKWLDVEFSLKGEVSWITKKLTQSSIINRLHFVKRIVNKKYAVIINIKEIEEIEDTTSETDMYSQEALVFISGQKVEFRAFIDAIFNDRNADIYIELNYENNDYCEKLASVIEPLIPIPQLLREIELDVLRRQEEISNIEEQINRALDDRDWELVKELNEQKQTLIRRQ